MATSATVNFPQVDSPPLDVPVPPVIAATDFIRRVFRMTWKASAGLNVTVSAEPAHPA